MPDELHALSPLDGRYAQDTALLRDFFSEWSVIRSRVQLEISYLIALSRDAGLIRPLTSPEIEALNSLSRDFSSEEANWVKEIERTTRHDVKAVENFLRTRLAQTSLSDLLEYLHFGLTSEDVNNIGIAGALRESRERCMLPALDRIIRQLEHLVRAHKATPMLARTHGQPAVPTTFGKEMAVFLSRLRRQRKALARHRFEGKLNGAVGNYNALAAAAPQIDWPAFSERFLRSLNLEPASLTTQILPYDNWIDYFGILVRINSILTGLAQDLWFYASLGYLRLKVQASEAGSSTMPQKVNPIDFENAEGNLGIANALMEYYTRKLPASRLQRDLSDSTVRRTFGVALGHALVAYTSVSRGLDSLTVDTASMQAELEAHWEVVAEGAQTILRAAGVPDAYETLKVLTRGKGLTKQAYSHWIEELKVDEAVKARLRWLSPLSYGGLSERLADAALTDRSA